MALALTSRISLVSSEPEQPEDYLSTALGVIFPDDVTNQHGDAEHSLVYTSPYLAKPLALDLADPDGETDRRLFSHYLWNSSLLLAELIERDTLPVADAPASQLAKGTNFDVRGKSVVELGAGTALPSIMAGLLGAQSVLVTDYPAEKVLSTLRTNVKRNIRPEFAPPSAACCEDVAVQGHSWGQEPEESHRHAFDRVVAADCLWMPWQHENLARSIDFFLSKTSDARCWVVAGFHTGRPKMRGFFDSKALAAVGLVVEAIWESECDGSERPWAWDREEDPTIRKRWLTVASLKRPDV